MGLLVWRAPSPEARDRHRDASATPSQPVPRTSAPSEATMNMSTTASQLPGHLSHRTSFAPNGWGRGEEAASFITNREASSAYPFITLQGLVYSDFLSHRTSFSPFDTPLGVLGTIESPLVSVENPALEHLIDYNANREGEPDRSLQQSPSTASLVDSPQGPAFTFVQMRGALPSMIGVCSNELVHGVSIEAWTNDGTRFAIRATKWDVSADAREESVDDAITFGLSIRLRAPQDRLVPQWAAPRRLIGMINVPASVADLTSVKQGIESACMVTKRRYHAEAAPGPV
jgi:hypothetical protein